MPTYEYRCEKGHTFEQFQKMSDPPVDVCPQCGAAAERLMSAGAGLVFKGSGFYITDYRSEGYKKAAESDKTGSAGSAGAAAPPDSGSKGGESAPAKAEPSAPAAPAPAASNAAAKPSGPSSTGGTAKPSKD